MRRSPTRAERRIWAWLRDRTFSGFKFKRQYPIERYVLDFYCAELKLAVELDGEQHFDPAMVEYDGQRTFALALRGIEVLRFPNRLLATDSLLVEEIIRHANNRRAK